MLPTSLTENVYLFLGPLSIVCQPLFFLPSGILAFITAITLHGIYPLDNYHEGKIPVLPKVAVVMIIKIIIKASILCKLLPPPIFVLTNSPPTNIINKTIPRLRMRIGWKYCHRALPSTFSISFPEVIKNSGSEMTNMPVRIPGG